MAGVQNGSSMGRAALANRAEGDGCLPGSGRALAALAALPFLALGQTQIDLASQSKRVDFSAASTTKPLKSGTSLPGTCTAGEMYFKTNAPAGQNVYGCAAPNTWTLQGDGNSGGGSGLPSMSGNSGRVLSTDGATAQWADVGGDVAGQVGALTVQKLQSRPVSVAAPQSGQALIWNSSTGVWEPQTVAAGQGTLTLQSNGVVVGTRGVENFIAGPGITNAIADTGSRIDIQQSMDSAVVQTRMGLQSGNTLYCASAGGSATSYTCGMNPALTSYTLGMVVRWRPDVAGAGGATTIDIDFLGAKAVKVWDGSDPIAADIAAGALYEIWYDGVNFRILGALNRLRSGTRPGCDATQRGRMWHIFGGTGVKDDVAICAKDAANAYAWRAVY
jgi:hypothetical protein